jgi:hypothetical protein
LVASLFLHADAVSERRPRTDGIGVREIGRVRLADNIGGGLKERRLRSQEHSGSEKPGRQHSGMVQVVHKARFH